MRKGVSLPLRGEQNAPEVGVSRKRDPIHVKGLPLQPVGSFPDGEDGGDLRVGSRQRDLQTEPQPGSGRAEVIDYLEPGFPGQIIDPAEIDQEVKSHLRVVVQKPAQGQEVLGPDLQGGLPPETRRLRGPLREISFSPGPQRLPDPWFLTFPAASLCRSSRGA